MPFKRVAINQGRQPRTLVKRSRRQGEGGSRLDQPLPCGRQEVEERGG